MHSIAEHILMGIIEPATSQRCPYALTQYFYGLWPHFPIISLSQPISSVFYTFRMAKRMANCPDCHRTIRSQYTGVFQFDPKWIIVPIKCKKLLHFTAPNWLKTISYCWCITSSFWLYGLHTIERMVCVWNARRLCTNVQMCMYVCMRGACVGCLCVSVCCEFEVWPIQFVSTLSLSLCRSVVGRPQSLTHSLSLHSLRFVLFEWCEAMNLRTSWLICMAQNVTIFVWNWFLLWIYRVFGMQCQM